MFNTYNMGVGMSIILPESQANAALDILKKSGEDAYMIGRVVTSDKGVIFE